MKDFQLRFFPVEGGGKNGYLGYGSIQTGLIICQFTVFKNDKFQQGFAIKFPSRKNDAGEWSDQAFFKDRDSSNMVYAELAKMMNSKSSIPGGSANTSSSNYNQGISHVERQVPVPDISDDDIPF